jgi:protein O-mannosyl-transferase
MDGADSYRPLGLSRNDVLTMLSIGVVVISAYLPAIQGGFIWDDGAHVTKPDLRSLHGLWRIWFEVGATQQYYPLLHSTFWLEHRLWGDAAVGYHIANILLHVLAASLLLVVLRRLKVPGAALAAASFALHPVHVESVAWITEQKNTLSTVFYFSALLAYLRFDEKRQVHHYAIASTIFVMALLTKTVTGTLPAALLVIFWWQRGHLSWRRDVGPLLPWFVVGAIGGLVTAWVERNLIGAEGARFEFSLLQRTILAGRVVWFYLGRLLLPVNLTFIYPRWSLNPLVWWHYLYPLGVLGAVATTWMLRRKWRAPLAVSLLFIGTLFPVLGFFNVFPFIFSFVADHFQYLASAGIIAAASATFAVISTRMEWPRWQGLTLSIALLALLGTMTWRQSLVYTDAQTLYRATISKNPACAMCRNNLGVLLSDSGQTAAAIEQFEEFLRLNPDDHMAFAAHNNLGLMLSRWGLRSEAIEHYAHSLRLKPNDTQVHFNLGSVLLDSGQPSEAAKHFEQVVKDLEEVVTIRPRTRAMLAEAHYRLGNALVRLERLSEAKAEYESALRINPYHAEAVSKLTALKSR